MLGGPYRTRTYELGEGAFTAPCNCRYAKDPQSTYLFVLAGPSCHDQELLESESRGLPINLRTNNLTCQPLPSSSCFDPFNSSIEALRSFRFNMWLALLSARAVLFFCTRYVSTCHFLFMFSLCSSRLLIEMLLVKVLHANA